METLIRNKYERKLYIRKGGEPPANREVIKEAKVRLEGNTLSYLLLLCLHQLDIQTHIVCWFAIPSSCRDLTPAIETLPDLVAMDHCPPQYQRTSDNPVEVKETKQFVMVIQS